MANRVKYTKHQIDLYFDRIALPQSKRLHSVDTVSESHQLNYLNLIQKHQLVKVPWENLTQHYSWHRAIHVSQQHLFRKIVHPDDPKSNSSGENANRGGYCMECNLLFHFVLYSLGFDVYMAGSRIYHANTHAYGGWTHLVNLVTIAGTKYMLDGGFGGNGPICPIPLVHDSPQAHIAPAEMRLQHLPISQNLDRNQKIWVFEHRYDVLNEWVPMYCFPELEFLPEDVQAMNFEQCLNPKSMFTHKVFAVRFTTETEKEQNGGLGVAGEDVLEAQIDGYIMLNHDCLKWRRAGKTVRHIQFISEDDRLDALERYFGIRFGEENRLGIKETAAEIGAGALQPNP